MINNFSDNIDFLPLGIFLKDSRALVISDLHIGFEDLLSRQGIQLPRNSYPEMKTLLKKHIELVSPKLLIINGDVKEYLARLSFQESSEMKDFIDFIKSYDIEIKFVRGNHDNFIIPLFNSEGIECFEKFLEIGDYFITHGHLNVSEDIKNSETRNVILGHEHASVVINSDGSNHKFKVIAECEALGKQFFILPAFSPLKSGCEMNVKDQKFLSPLLKNSNNFQYHLFEEDEWFCFKHEDITI